MKRTVTVEEGAGTYTQTIGAGNHTLYADEPENLGGTDRGPNPYDYLLSALGTCTSMTVRMYARRKQWPLEHVRVTLRHDKIHAEDCEDCETQTGKIDQIETDVELIGDELTGEQRERLMEIAHRCPVHRTMTEEVKIRVRPAAAAV